MAKKLNKFQKNIGKLANYTPIQPKGTIGAMMTAEEGAEVLKCFKSALKDGGEVDYDCVKEELGDSLTSIANACNEMGFKMKDISKAAEKKLAKRTGKSLDDK